MRKNVKKQLALRVLSTAVLMAMVSSIATAAFADTYDLNKGSVEILAANGEQRITQWEDKDNNLCVKDESYRFGLNAFKVLGGSFAMANYIADETGKDVADCTFD